jgi:YVTN family beta-propeller protein
MYYRSNFSAWLLACISLVVISCNAAHQATSGTQKETNIYYHPSDDSTLNRNVLPVLMPYNRIIDPAGKVIVYGNPELENHSLDLKLISGTSHLVVEDRYGIMIMDTGTHKILATWSFVDDKQYNNCMSTYSGIQVMKEADGHNQIFWSAADTRSKKSYVMRAAWNGKQIKVLDPIVLDAAAPAPMALPNELEISYQNGKASLLVVLNGNNQLVKIDLTTLKPLWTRSTGIAPYGITLAGDLCFVTNWAGPAPKPGAGKETAGVPYGEAYINPATGATSMGSVSVFNIHTGDSIREIQVGLHPNDIITSPDQQFVYVANGNSDDISVIRVSDLEVVSKIPVKLDDHANGFIGDTPNAMAIDPAGTTLYVANGMDNALAVVPLGADASASGRGKSLIRGFIPTEAYPGGVALYGGRLFVTNLEGEGARVNSRETKIGNDPQYGDAGAYNSHKQKATVSVISVPDQRQLAGYTQKVKALNLSFRNELSRLAPRKNIAPRPMPERIGEPSVFKHVVYIIKENRTYDQVLGDMKEGKGLKSLCIYGDSITPNQHQFARDFVLLDNYHASGKCSAEGHQWTDAAMVTDYVQKSVRAWFRSYPHVQEDALVYGEKGFIWNNAADHGKTVKIYGEACQPHYNKNLNWTSIYQNYKNGKPLEFYNTSTISRVRPMLSKNFPGSDDHNIADVIRADAFIRELKEYEAMPGDQFPNFVVMALSNDHTIGTRPGFPTPRAMVADNDLAVGMILEAISKSRFWESTAIFITEDDSQAGWDHVSAYRTTGFVISPYSRLKRTVSVNYNQTSMVRSIEQILGIPPMNALDASASPMFDCFDNNISLQTFTRRPAQIPLNEMNPPLTTLSGRKLHYARQSMRPEFDRIDRGDDGLMNEILWYDAKGEVPYPTKMSGKGGEDRDD